MGKNGQVTSPLVSCAALAESLAGPAVPVLLDVRWRLGGPPGRLDYDRAHLPGAVYVDLDTDLAAEPGPAGRHPLPDPADLERVLRAAGVRSDAPVVVYDDDNGSIAARAWWLLRWAGHTRVAVLDGGIAAWTAQDRPVTAEVSLPAPGDFVVRPGAMPVVDATGAAGPAAKPAPVAQALRRGIEMELARRKAANGHKFFHRPLPADAQISYFARGNLVEILMRSVHSGQIRMAEASCLQADLVLRPEIYDDRWADYRHPGKFIKLGREAAEQHLEEIKSLVAGKEVGHESKLASEPVAAVA